VYCLLQCFRPEWPIEGLAIRPERIYGIQHPNISAPTKADGDGDATFSKLLPAPNKALERLSLSVHLVLRLLGCCENPLSIRGSPRLSKNSSQA